MIKPCRAAATVTALIASISLVAAPSYGAPAMHKMVAVNDIIWGPAPPAMPAGASAAILYGDPSKEGLFTMRLKGPKGYTIPPHTHPRPEIVTVISGTVRLGMGSKLDATKARALPAGSFFSTEPGTAHFVIFDEDSVVQVNSSGPWSIAFVNPLDDPRTGARSDISNSACLMQGSQRLRVRPHRAVGTEPFWAARIEGRCVTYSNPEDQQGTRVWTRYSQRRDGDTWSGALGGQAFELRTWVRPGCTDGMSDKRYPIAVELLVRGQRRKGCAEPL